MTKQKNTTATVSRFNQTFEIVDGALVITTRHTGVPPAYLAVEKATQLQAILMVIEDAWSEVSEMHDDLAHGLIRLASTAADEIAGLALLADEMAMEAKKTEGKV